MRQLDRRGFLRSLGTGSLSAAVLLRSPEWRAQGDEGTETVQPVSHWSGAPLGRILLNVMTVYSEPTWRSAHTGVYLYWNDVVPVHEAVAGEGLYPRNNTWLRVDDGYIYAAWVQPVEQVVTPGVPPGERGDWAQVTVPFAWSLWSNSFEAGSGRQRERLYYSTVNRVMGMQDGHYFVREVYGGEYWVRADQMRLISSVELAPISPDVPSELKRIEISIRDQRLRAFEGDTVVFESLAATGVPSTPTPMGEYRIFLKRIGQRMVGGASDRYYNLPGVPYVCYFSQTYAAIHGTYWHNDYGRRHSNGCVNLSPAAAQWVFRWTTPVADYWSYSTSASTEQPGTRVIVRW